MEFENYAWYKNGLVSVRNGSSEVTGINTDWLKAGIKQGDVFLIDNIPYEIHEVTGNEVLSLVRQYSGTNQTEKTYAVIPRARAVLLSELALSLRQTLYNWNEREQYYQAQFKELKTKAQIVDSLGLYIDSDGDLAQNDSKDIVLPDDIPVASENDMQELLDEVFSNNQ